MSLRRIRFLSGVRLVCEPRRPDRLDFRRAQAGHIRRVSQRHRELERKRRQDSMHLEQGRSSRPPEADASVWGAHVEFGESKI